MLGAPSYYNLIIFFFFLGQGCIPTIDGIYVKVEDLGSRQLNNQLNKAKQNKQNQNQNQNQLVLSSSSSSSSISLISSKSKSMLKIGEEAEDGGAALASVDDTVDADAELDAKLKTYYLQLGFWKIKVNDDYSYDGVEQNFENFGVGVQAELFGKFLQAGASVGKTKDGRLEAQGGASATIPIKVTGSDLKTMLEALGQREEIEGTTVTYLQAFLHKYLTPLVENAIIVRVADGQLSAEEDIITTEVTGEFELGMSVGVALAIAPGTESEDGFWMVGGMIPGAPCSLYYGWKPDKTASRIMGSVPHLSFKITSTQKKTPKPSIRLKLPNPGPANRERLLKRRTKKEQLPKTEEVSEKIDFSKRPSSDQTPLVLEPLVAPKDVTPPKPTTETKPKPNTNAGDVTPPKPTTETKPKPNTNAGGLRSKSDCSTCLVQNSVPTGERTDQEVNWCPHNGGICAKPTDARKRCGEETIIWKPEQCK